MPSKGERTQQRIILAALELFAERGFTATSVRDIAARAGMTHAGLLHHFASKDDLLVRILEFREDQDVAKAERFAAYGVDHLFAWLIDVVETNQADSSRVMTFVRLAAEATDPGHPAHAYFSRRYERILAALEAAFDAHFALTPPSSPVSARDAAIGIVALMDGLQLQWLIRPDTLVMTTMVQQHLATLGIAVSGTEAAADAGTLLSTIAPAGTGSPAAGSTVRASASALTPALIPPGSKEIS